MLSPNERQRETQLKRTGGFCLQLSKIYPDLFFTVQDRAPALEQAKHEVWPRENPQALADGRVEFFVHDFFKENPVAGADVYWLRYVLYVWPSRSRINPIHYHQKIK